jgi:hypothetical protein
VLRLYLTFIGGLGRGFIGPRPSHYVDLQYLFYAPFCMVFVSSDKFHREMWPATSDVNTFVWGPDLKKELQQRIQIYSALSEQERRAHGYPFFPVEIPDSIIHQVWQKYIRLPLTGFNPKDAEGEPKTIDDLEPEIQEHLKEAGRVLDDARRRRTESKG